MSRKIAQLVAVFLWSGTALFAGQVQQYSADMVTHSGGETFSGKVYVDGDRLRYEMPQSIVITRLDLQKSYILMTSEKMYMEQAVDPSAAAKAGVVEGMGDVERVSEGKEDVDGRPAEKFKISYTGPTGLITVYQWVDGDGLPVKVESGDGSWNVEYQNVQKGPQSQDLFEVPADYQKFVMPSLADMGLGAGQ